MKAAGENGTSNGTSSQTHQGSSQSHSTNGASRPTHGSGSNAGRVTFINPWFQTFLARGYQENNKYQRFL
jgi:hypothetical protein